MSLIEYNFGGIESSAGDLHGAVARTSGLLDEGQASLANLRALWTGEGGLSYDQAQTRWDNNSLELNSALQSLAQAVSEAGVTMGGTENGVIGLFT